MRFKTPRDPRATLHLKFGSTLTPGSPCGFLQTYEPQGFSPYRSNPNAPGALYDGASATANSQGTLRGFGSP